MKRCYWTLLAAAVVSPILLVALYRTLGGTSTTPRAFDSTAWLKGDERTRGFMVYSLIDDKRLIGCSADEMRTLLGRPDEEEPLMWRYTITRDYGNFDSWSEVFIVKFNDVGSVSEAFVDD